LEYYFEVETHNMTHPNAGPQAFTVNKTFKHSQVFPRNVYTNFKNGKVSMNKQ